MTSALFDALDTVALMWLSRLDDITELKDYAKENDMTALHDEACVQRSVMVADYNLICALLDDARATEGGNQ